MYGPPGHAYVYLIYGIWNCLNFVTRAAGEPQAVLVRALEPAAGVDRCNGPGLLCRALKIDRALDGVPLEPPILYLMDDGFVPAEVHQARRVGVDYAGDWKDRPWRFCLDSAHLSKPVPAGLRRPRAPGAG
jgi:DNA-3-methyladenine glycosylase